MTVKAMILEILGDSEMTLNTVRSKMYHTPYKISSIRNGMVKLHRANLVEKVWRGSVHEPMYRRKR